MATVILDLQPFNQVNRWGILKPNVYFWWQYFQCWLPDAMQCSRSNFHLELWFLLSQPPFQGLKKANCLDDICNFLRSMIRGRRPLRTSFPRRSHSLQALPWMVGLFTTMDTSELYQVLVSINVKCGFNLFYQITSHLTGGGKLWCLAAVPLMSVITLQTSQSGWSRSWTTGSWTGSQRWLYLIRLPTNLASSTLTWYLTCLNISNHPNAPAMSCSFASQTASSPGTTLHALSRIAGTRTNAKLLGFFSDIWTEMYRFT